MDTIQRPTIWTATFENGERTTISIAATELFGETCAAAREYVVAAVLGMDQHKGRSEKDVVAVSFLGYVDMAIQTVPPRRTDTIDLTPGEVYRFTNTVDRHISTGVFEERNQDDDFIYLSGFHSDIGHKISPSVIKSVVWLPKHRKDVVEKRCRSFPYDLKDVTCEDFVVCRQCSRRMWRVWEPITDPSSFVPLKHFMHMDGQHFRGDASLECPYCAVGVGLPLLVEVIPRIPRKDRG